MGGMDKRRTIFQKIYYFNNNYQKYHCSKIFFKSGTICGQLSTATDFVQLLNYRKYLLANIYRQKVSPSTKLDLCTKSVLLFCK